MPLLQLRFAPRVQSTRTHHVPCVFPVESKKLDTRFIVSQVLNDFGGQVGVGDKARIESKAVIGSGSGILTSKIVRAGEPVWGTPARALKDYLEVLATMNRLPEMREQLKQALAKIDELEKR